MYKYGEIVHGEISLRRNLLTAEFPYGEIPFGEIPYGEIPYGESSYGEISGHGGDMAWEWLLIWRKSERVTIRIKLW